MFVANIHSAQVISRLEAQAQQQRQSGKLIRSTVSAAHMDQVSVSYATFHVVLGLCKSTFRCCYVLTSIIKQNLERMHVSWFLRLKEACCQHVAFCLAGYGTIISCALINKFGPRFVIVAPYLPPGFRSRPSVCADRAAAVTPAGPPPSIPPLPALPAQVLPSFPALLLPASFSATPPCPPRYVGFRRRVVPTPVPRRRFSVADASACRRPHRRRPFRLSQAVPPPALR